MLLGGESVEYTVQKLGKLAGVSTRTLRYYDEIGILKPARINSSGYRIYGQKEVERLQIILFYRELDVSLESIKNIVTMTSFDETATLIDHRKKLLDKRDQLDKLINNVDKSIDANERRIVMKDKERFEGFKQKMIDGNEKKYGTEIREKYGAKQVEKSNKKIKGMTQEEYAEVEKLGDDIIIALKEAFVTGNPGGTLAQKVADMHRKWICYYWDSYTKKAHAGLAQMYVDDERFKAYYDKDQPGLAEFLRDAIIIYTAE